MNKTKQCIVLARPGVACQAELHWSKNLSLGLAYLAAYLREQGILVHVVDGKDAGHLTPEETAAAIAAYNSDVVGISCLTVDFKNASLIAGELKRRMPQVKIILGGAHINALPEQSLYEAEAADYIIAGQAEVSLYKLISTNFDKTGFEEIYGLFWRDENGKVRSSDAENDGIVLENMPFPAWDLFPRSRAYPMMTERGCPYTCVFCSHNLTRKIKSRSVDHVLSEISWLKEKFNASHVAFEDETFGLNAGRANAILDGLKELNEDQSMSFIAQTRVDCFTEEMASKMRAAGFEFISFGIESCDSEVLASSGKNITVEKVFDSVKIARKVGLKLWLKFIIGLPGETKKSVVRTIKNVAKINPEKISIAAIVAYPGSMIYQWAKNGENGYKLLTNDWNKFDKYLDTSVELETLSSLQIRRLQTRMYLEVYLRNFRFREVFDILKNNMDILKKIFTQMLFR